MTIAELRHQVAVLGRRLQDGEHKMVAAEAQGAYVRRWEDHWLELLRQYETRYDRLQRGEDGRLARWAS